MKPNLRRMEEIYRGLAGTYDRRIRRAQIVREEAVDLLELRAGDVVLDVGCGTGLSFPLFEKRLGEKGRIIGVDLSPDMLALARERVRENGWENTALIQAAAENAVLPQSPDAVFFHFTHDVLRSEQALENVFRQTKGGGRVVSAGGKWSHWWAVPVNAYIWLGVRRTVTTMEGFRRPWTHLERFVPGLMVEPRLFGAAYVAWGKLPAKAGVREP